MKTILFLAAGTKEVTKLDLEKEASSIEQELKRLGRNAVFEFKVELAQTAEDLRHALVDHQPQVIHFAGHGSGSKGIVLGQQELLSTDTLEQYLAPHQNTVECVILNACFSAVQASAIIKHIPFVVGMNQAVADSAAIQFAVGFYDAWAGGLPIEAAFQTGQASIKSPVQNAIPVLKKRYPETVWQVPINENPFFTGRQEVLHQLQQALHFRQVAALSGLGGIGKTQTAAFYAYSHRHEYQAVLWLFADTQVSLENGLASLTRLLNLPEQDVPEQAQQIAAVKRWLNTHNDWLLILDNADEVKLAQELMPLLSKDLGITRHLLLTTRATNTEPYAQRVSIAKMELWEGRHFLLRRAIEGQHKYGSMSFHPQEYIANQIVTLLDYLPLALDQAGAYICETQCSLEDYLALYQNHASKLLARRGTSVTDHQKPVAKTWLLSFEKVEQESGVALDILRLCAFLEADTIPEEVLGVDDFELNEALHVLLKYSLLQRQPNKILMMHRLVQRVLQDEMTEDEQRGWAEKAVRATIDVFPESGDYLNWPLLERLLPCALVCAELIETWDLEIEEAALLLNQTGYYLDDKANYAQAKPLFELSLAIREKVLGKEHPDVASSLNNLAELLRGQGDYAQAKLLYERALAIYEKVHGKEHPDVATSLNNLALLLNNQGDYAQAKPPYERALAIDEKVYGKDHPEVATDLNNLAGLFYAQGDYAQAKPLYERSLAIIEKVLGKEHPDVATSLNNLASLLDHQGDYAQAKPLYERSLAIIEKVLGKEHPDVATSLNNIAGLLDNQGDYAQAKPLYERALAIREKVLGKEHPDVASSLNNLAELLRGQGDYAQAKPLYERALAIYEKVHGKEHPDVATSLNNLAYLLDNQGDYAQAKPLYERALAIFKKVLGPDHPNTRTVSENYTLFLEEMKK